MNKFFSTGRTAVMAVFFISIFAFSSCNSGKDSLVSNFEHIQQRPWIGPEYWANPLQDWQLNDGRIECIVSGGDRNLFLLTRELDDSHTGFQTSVKIGSLSENIAGEEGWIGFKVGIRGDYKDYRDNAVRGDGLPVGISTKGQLFIGRFDEGSEVINPDWNGMILDLSVEPGDEEMKAILLALDADGQELGRYERSIQSDWFTGGISLACSAGKVPETPDQRPEIMYGNWGFKEGTRRKGDVKAWFSDWTLLGEQVVEYPERSFGPILWAQYTLSKKVVKLTAQMAPVGKDDSQQVFIDLKHDGKWTEEGVAEIDQYARTATFKLKNWDSNQEVPYRIRYSCFTSGSNQDEFLYEGMIRKEPWGNKELVVAGFTGNNDLGFPNNDIYKSVEKQNPDFLFFSGDQIYEGVGGYGTQTKPLEAACLDYLRKWYLYGWAYGELLKDRPSVAIPDDHDVYHGNLWGAGGIATPEGLSGAAAQDKGGFKFNPIWVNTVQRTQTSHLPDPFDPTPVAQDIGVYYTSINYAGVSFAVIEDRKFKSGPAPLMPDAKIVNGWSKNPKWDAAKTGDVEGAILLDPRQLDFLEEWAADWSDSVWMKVVLSQTIFANVATLPEEDARTDANVPRLRILNEGEYAPNDIPVQDHDSNGWPQTPRNKALKKMRKAYAFHIAGDQHLGSVIEYGIDTYHDAGFAFCVPAISNVWPRRWFPQEESANQISGKPKYTGDFLDGFGNLMTVHAISNPVYTGMVPPHLYDRATGFGIIRFEPDSRDIVMECWKRVTEAGENIQYSDWPVRVNQFDNYLSEAEYGLPVIKVPDMTDPVVQVIDESDGSIVYTIRIKGNEFKPMVEKMGSYSIAVSATGSNPWKVFKGFKAKALPEGWEESVDLSKAVL